MQTRWLLLLLGAVIVVGVIAGIARLVTRDLDQQNRLINVSARGPAGTGAETLLVGFVIADGPQKVIVRAMGPSLAAPGGPPALTRMLLRVVRNDTGKDVGRNEAWRVPGNEGLWGDLKQFAPPHPADTACVLTLAPGGYSALVELPPGEKGIAAIEIFAVPP